MTDRAWRQQQREKLKRLRGQISSADRVLLDAAIMRRLDTVPASRSADCIAIYWPLRGEPNLRDWYHKIAQSGTLLALPVVVHRHQALEFRQWELSNELVRDALDIPCPAPARPVHPDIVVTPCVGFDPQGFRLGSGGGFYDRTLAALRPPPLVIGVAYERQRLASIRPESHDIAANFVVTEERVYSLANKSGE